MNEQMKENNLDNNIDNSSKVHSPYVDQFDEIEQKDRELKQMKNKTYKYKKESIKEFVYTNRQIPILWKSQKNFDKLVLEMFAEDNNFLQYLGNDADISDISKKNKNISRPKTSISKKKSLTSTNLQFDNKKINTKKKILRIGSLESIRSLSNSNIANIHSLNSSKFGKTKIKKNSIITPGEKMENIFDDLQEQFPIKKKFEELYPELATDEVKIKNNNMNSVKNLIDKSKLHKIMNMEKNIYNNLFPKKLRNSINNQKNQFLGKNKKYKIKSMTSNNFGLNTFKLKTENRKEISKKDFSDAKIYNQLKRVNFYGPYFSYCPYCFDKNIKYYKNMDKNQCLNLLNCIKLDRSKKLENEEFIFKDRLKKK